MTKKILFGFLGIHALFFSVQSQDTLLVSGPELVQKVLEMNLQSRIANKQVEMSRADVYQSRALFMPSVTASHTAMTTTNPLMAFGSKLNQEILSPADFDPAELNAPERVNNFATEIQVLQPLINLDGVYERQAAKIQSEAYELQARRIGEHIELEANKAYMQLQLAYEAVDVLKRALEVAEEGVKQVSDYYEQGLVQKADVLSVEVRKVEVENQLRYATSNIRNASDYLTVLIGEDVDGRIYQPAERIPVEIEKEVFSAEIPSYRKDLAAMDRSVQGYQKMLKSKSTNSLPRINAFGSYQLYDNQLMGFGADGYLVGIQLSWNLFNGYKNIGKVYKAKAEMEKAEIERQKYKNEGQFELNMANRQLLDAEAKVALSKQAWDQSTEAYRIRKDRFSEGLEKTSDVLMSETLMFEKELEYRQAIFEYNFTKEYLRFLTR